MCIIVYKKPDVAPPSREVLERQYNNNHDGCGYMWVKDNAVMVRKGFMNFEDFYKDYQKTLKDIGEKEPMIFHFRISTQAGVCPEFTHPFPLTTRQDAMTWTNYKCPIGIVHNGIISLTSNSYAKNYSDTSKFINDYLTLIIKSGNLNDLKENQKLLIQRLINGSRMAFLDKYKNVCLIGNFITDKKTGLIFSNSTYDTDKYKPAVTVVTPLKTAVAKAKYKCCKDEKTNTYYFMPEIFCPALDGCYGYCSHCAYKEECSRGKKKK